MINSREKIINTKKITILLATFFILVSVATYIVFTQNLVSTKYDHRLVIGLLLGNIGVVLALLVVIFQKTLRVWRNRKKEEIGSRLQKRIIQIFSLLTIIPTLIMVGFSIFFFIYGLQGWFDKKISSALDNSVEVAQAYLKEHSANLRADAYAISKDLNLKAKMLVDDMDKFEELLKNHVEWRALTEAVIFRKKDILATSSQISKFFTNLEDIANEAMQKADKGEIVLIFDDKSKVKALIKLKAFKDTYLLVTREFDPKVLSYTIQTKDSVTQYNILKENTKKIQIQFALVFMGVSLVLLLTSVWLGLVFSGRIVAPIHKLISATERVRSGDLTVRLEEGKKNDEITTLFKAFNRMAGNLQKNNFKLMEVNKQIDERRGFIEAVFSGVNSGVLSLDEYKRVKLYNNAAVKILKLENEKVMDRFVADVFPEITLFFKRTKDFGGNIYQQDIDIKRDGMIYNLLVRIVTEHKGKNVEGYIITIDNITRLVNAQRMAAWSDVARRIAHEIKNPLTPITLSAERVRKKCQKEMKDSEGINRYIDTIIRHAENIEMIVKEFSEFARMPQPTLARNNLTKLINDVVFSEQVVNNKLAYNLNLPQGDIEFDFDKEQMGRVLLNLLKNAAESINESGKGEPGEINISLVKNNNIVLEIYDNGKGFPPELLNQVTEPYVTTRQKGTGLGLAIVKKIIDDHSASLELLNRTDEEGNILGAFIRITFLIH